MSKLFPVFFLVLLAEFTALSQAVGESRYERLDSAYIEAAGPKPGRGSYYLYTPEESWGEISVTGEPDIIRRLSTLPGISQGVEGGLGLYVRGGNAGNNRLELDGVPIYGASHLFGLMSSVTPEIIAFSEARTGGFSASSGNFTSGLIAAELKSGHTERPAFSFSASPYIEGAYTEFSSGAFDVQAGGRYSPIPQLGGVITRIAESYSCFGGLVYDLTASVSRRLDDRNSLELTLFSSVDRLDVENERAELDWGWTTWMAKLGWSSRLDADTNLELMIYGSGSNSSQSETQIVRDRRGTRAISGNLYEITAKCVADRRFSDKFSLSGGMEAMYQFGGFNISAFADTRVKLLRIVDFAAGFRQTIHIGPEIVRAGFDLHLLADISLGRNFGLEFSFDRTNQYHHVLEGLPTGWAMNLPAPIDDEFPEETASQVYAGLFSRLELPADDFFGTMELHFNLGAYYKAMDNLVSYISSTNMFRYTSSSWRYDVDSGSGSSRGVESSLSLSCERLDLNLSYTWSHTDRCFPEINGGRPFPFKFDRPHILNSRAAFTISDRTGRSGNRVRQRAGMVVSYSSGNLMTAVLRQYEGSSLPYWDDYSYDVAFVNQIFNRMEMSSVNGFRLPAYFRIDVSYGFEIYRPRTVHNLDITVFNVLNRHNPYMIYNDGGVWKQISIIPLMPSLRWSVSF